MVLAWIIWRDWEKVQRLSSDQVTWITFTVEMACDQADDNCSVDYFVDPGDAFTELQSSGVDGSLTAYGRHIEDCRVKPIERGEWLCFVLDRNRSIYSLHESRGVAVYDGVNFSREDVLRIWPPWSNGTIDQPVAQSRARPGPKGLRDWSEDQAWIVHELRTHGDPRTDGCQKYASLEQLYDALEERIETNDGVQNGNDYRSAIKGQVRRILDREFPKP